jgi:hypothetical protein
VWSWVRTVCDATELTDVLVTEGQVEGEPSSFTREALDDSVEIGLKDHVSSIRPHLHEFQLCFDARPGALDCVEAEPFACRRRGGLTLA